MPIVYFSSKAWHFLQEVIAEGKLDSVRSCLERATKKHGDRIVDCRDRDVAELRAFLDQEIQDKRARVRRLVEANMIREQWRWDLERATGAQKNLDEATGALVIEPSTRSRPASIPQEYDEAYEVGYYLFWYEKWCERVVLAPAERSAIGAVIMETKREPHIDADMAPYVRRLKDAYRRAGERVLQEVRDLSFLNRCPRCGRIVRTPRARLCTWCHHDWHEAPDPRQS